MKKSVSVDGSDSEYYQFSKGVRMVYSTGRQVLADAVFNGEEIRTRTYLQWAWNCSITITLTAFWGLTGR